MEQLQKDQTGYIGYEYKTVHIDTNQMSLCMDAYSNFGWKLDENGKSADQNSTAIYLKRDRKIINKAELTRLQRHFEDCLRQIDKLEKKKTSKATTLALITGVIGTAFMAGATFAITAQTPAIVLCILLAIPGFAGWIAPVFLYQYFVRKDTAMVEPLIGNQYEEIYVICEKGRKLLSII